MILAIPGSFDAVESVVLKSGKTQKDPTLTAREIWESGHKCLWIVLDRAGMSIRPPLFSVTPIAHPRNWYLIQLSRSPRALCGGFTAHHFTTSKRFHRIGPDSVRREEVLHRCDRRRGRFLHPPVSGIRYNDFLHARRRVAHDDPHVGAEGLLGADGEHRHRQLRLHRLEVVGLVLLVDREELRERGMHRA